MLFYGFIWDHDSFRQLVSRWSFALSPLVVKNLTLGCSHTTKPIFPAVFPEADIDTSIWPSAHPKAMTLIGSEAPLIKGSITVMKVTLALKLVFFELSNIEGVLLWKIEFACSVSYTIFPLALVKVAIGPLVYSDSIRLVIVVVSKVDALVCV